VKSLLFTCSVNRFGPPAPRLGTLYKIQDLRLAFKGAAENVVSLQWFAARLSAFYLHCLIEWREEMRRFDEIRLGFSWNWNRPGYWYAVA
jgi:hypothetical protein